MEQYEIKLWQTKHREGRGLPPVVKIMDSTGFVVITMGEQPDLVNGHYEPGRLAKEVLATLNGQMLPLAGDDVQALRDALDLVKSVNHSVAQSLFRVARLLRGAIAIANDAPGQHEGIERVADELTDIMEELQDIVRPGGDYELET